MTTLPEQSCSSSASCTNNDLNFLEDEEDDEVEAAEKVINALLFYKRYFLNKIRRQADAVKKLDTKGRQLVLPILANHVKAAHQCADQNQKIFDMIVNSGVNMLDNSSAIQKAFDQSSSKPASEHYMSKAKSTLKQIVREWSSEGAMERQSCYGIVIDAIEKQYPNVDERYSINILVAGAGLGRLAWEFLQRGFSVQGNEFSIFMLLTSNFILNRCSTTDEFTIYPYLLDFSNSWSFSEQLRSITFPDVNPTTGSTSRNNTFSMCAGDFLQAYSEEENIFDSVVSVFFLDTASNLIHYIERTNKILKPGGVWVNFGPLTYHFEDSEELSLELPFDVIVGIIEKYGFRIDKYSTKNEHPPSFYTCNQNSMLQYTYHCGFFQCTKL